MIVNNVYNGNILVFGNIFFRTEFEYYSAFIFDGMVGMLLVSAFCYLHDNFHDALWCHKSNSFNCYVLGFINEAVVS